MKQSRSRKVLYWLVYLSFLFCTTEIGLRVFFHFTRGTSLTKIRLYLDDPYVMWRYNPGYTGRYLTYKSIRINNLGFLGRDVQIPKKNGVVRIVSLGGSVGFGMGAKSIEKNFCSILQNKLDQSTYPRKFEVVNAGIVGYSSWHGRQFVEHYLANLDPDVLLVAFGWNDSLKDNLPDSKSTQSAKRQKFLDTNFIKDHSMLGSVILTVSGRALKKMGLGRKRNRMTEAYQSYRVPLDEYTDNLKQIKDWCMTHHVKLVFWTESVAFKSSWENQVNEVLPYQDAMRREAVQWGVPLADVALTFRDLDMYKYFDNPQSDCMHANEAGQEVMAEVVYQRLCTAVLDSMNIRN
jgi:lysophospholipase L1-like esterase